MLPANPDRSAEMRPLIRTLGAKAYSSRTSHTPPAHRLDTQISPERVFCLVLDRARSRGSTVIFLTLFRSSEGPRDLPGPTIRSLSFVSGPPGGTVTEAGATSEPLTTRITSFCWTTGRREARRPSDPSVDSTAPVAPADSPSSSRCPICPRKPDGSQLLILLT